VPNIYNNIDNNKRETILIMAIFVAVVSFIGWFLGEYMLGRGFGFSAMAIALIFSGFSSIFSYYFSDQMVLAISGAREVKQTENSYLHNLVGNLCIGAGLPKPRIYMITDTAMNAFATGRDPQHAVICFTSGIVEGLEKLELEGVIAHELSHIQNYDIRLMSIVSILVGTVTLIADWFTRGFFYGRGRKRSGGDGEIGGILFIVGIILVILSPIIATLIKLALSRNREYLADASGALLTRYPAGLASALRKISSDKEVLEAANGATAHLYIANPLKASQVSGALASMFDTHPPVAERIKRLEQM
jgi:heat shock protein HtpX